MSERPPVFEHLGPNIEAPPIGAFCDLTERVWSTYLDLAGGYRHEDPKSREFLIVRMLYIAEITSSAIRLNASWSLTHAAMSLLRDRYEQVVRFSWLVRNPDQTIFQQYERSMFAKINSIIRNMAPETRASYQKTTGLPLPAWATDTLTKEQKAQFGAWGSLDLRSMAQKRDAFPPLADTVLAKEGLAESYEAIYSQFSSVTHYDRFGIDLIGLQPRQDASFVLGTEPYWPGMLILKNALFDIIQCFEAAQICHKSDAALTFERFLAEWLAISKALLPR